MREHSRRSSGRYPLRIDESTRYGVRVADDQEEKPSEGPVEQRPPPTPFDHPLFLPVLLTAGTLWFGYDGWINQDPDMLEHRDFNRYGFALLVVLAGWFGFKGWREWRAGSADEPPPPTA